MPPSLPLPPLLSGPLFVSPALYPIRARVIPAVAELRRLRLSRWGDDSTGHTNGEESGEKDTHERLSALGSTDRRECMHNHGLSVASRSSHLIVLSRDKYLSDVNGQSAISLHARTSLKRIVINARAACEEVIFFA